MYTIGEISSSACLFIPINIPKALPRKREIKIAVPIRARLTKRCLLKVPGKSLKKFIKALKGEGIAYSYYVDFRKLYQ